MKPTKKSCLTLLLMVVVTTLAEAENTFRKPNTSESSYQMAQAEAKVLAETKAYLEGGGKVDAVDNTGRTRLHKAE